MARTFLPSCLLPCVLGVLVCITAVGSSGIDWYRYRFTPLTSTEQELQELYSGPGTRGTEFSPHPILPPYLLLPMFRQQPAPFTSKLLFRPSVGRRVLPSTLENILIPQNLQEDQTRALPVSNDRGVEVWCGYSKVSVRVNLALLGFRSSAHQFRFGTCEVSRSDGSFIYFHYDLNDCGGLFSVMNEQLIYSNNLVYKPDPHGFVIRSLPLILNIQCVYNRFHYSYKIGYIPDVGEHTFRKRLGTKGVFSLSVYNEMWEKSSVNESFTLGQQMNFEASVDFTWKDQSIFVEACHATESNDPNSSPRYDLITNFGCLIDSKMTGSQSRFVLRQKNILRFSIDAFLFPQSTSEIFYLHCSLFVGNSAVSSTTKSCTYSKEQSSTQRAVVTSDACSLNLHKFLQESEVDTEPEDEMVVHHLHDINNDDEEEEMVEDYELEEVLIGKEDFENNTMIEDQQAEDDEDDEGNMKQQEEENMMVGNAEQEQQLEVLVVEMKNEEPLMRREE
ncbi:zona pellucida glycoprotein 3d tandem duplicate 1 [Trichomycterus rosablanca]|uniref:zona pellucida glycoprotein 3d tandem duplicate 1 n=1 Tax=Trichomycterus rosablanca TaxID=2290929 RepID=UPI002F359132